MNPEFPQTPREELEARLTALLLGELSAEEASEVRAAIAKDPELAKLHARLEQTLGLVREVAASPSEPATAQAEPLRLSEERREKLLAHFKTITPPEFVREKKRIQIKLVELVAVLAIVGILAALLFPAGNYLHGNKLMEAVGELNPSYREAAATTSATEATTSRMAADSSLERAKAELVSRIQGSANVQNVGLITATNSLNWSLYAPEDKSGALTLTADSHADQLRGLTVDGDRYDPSVFQRTIGVADADTKGDGAQSVNLNYLNYEKLPARPLRTEIALPSTDHEAKPWTADVSMRGFYDDNLNSAEGAKTKGAGVSPAQPGGSGGANPHEVNLAGYITDLQKPAETDKIATDKSGVAAGVPETAFAGRPRTIAESAVRAPDNYAVTAQSETRAKIVLPATEPTAPAEVALGLAPQTQAGKWFDADADGGRNRSYWGAGGRHPDWGNNPPAPQKPAIEFKTASDEQRGRGLEMPDGNRGENLVVSRNAAEPEGSVRELGRLSERRKMDDYLFVPQAVTGGKQSDTPLSKESEVTTAGGRIGGARGAEAANPVPATPPVVDSSTGLPLPIPSLSTADNQKLIEGRSDAGAFKADLVAPGTFVASGRAGDAPTSAGQSAGPGGGGTSPSKPSDAAATQQTDYYFTAGTLQEDIGGLKYKIAERSKEIKDATPDAAKDYFGRANQPSSDALAPAVPPPPGHATIIAGVPVPGAAEAPPAPVLVPESPAIAAAPVDTLEDLSLRRRYVESGTKPTSQPKLSPSQSLKTPVRPTSIPHQEPIDTKGGAVATLGGYAGLPGAQQTDTGISLVAPDVSAPPPAAAQPLTSDPIAAPTLQEAESLAKKRSKAEVAATTQNNFGAIVANGGTTPNSTQFGDATTTLSYSVAETGTNRVALGATAGGVPADAHAFYRLKLNDDDTKAEVAGRTTTEGLVTQLADNNGKTDKAPVLGDLPMAGRLFRSESQTAPQERKTSETFSGLLLPAKPESPDTSKEAKDSVAQTHEAWQTAKAEQKTDVASLNKQLAESQKQVDELQEVEVARKRVDELRQQLKISDFDALGTAPTPSLHADEVQRLQKEAATSPEARKKLEDAKTADFAKNEASRPYYEAKAKLEDLENFRKIINMRRSAESIDVNLPRSMLVEVIDRAEPAKEKNAGAFAKLGSFFASDYESKARVKVEKDSPDIPGMSGRDYSGTYDPYFVQTEQEAIRSEAVLGKVVDKLALDKEWAKKSGGKNLKKSEAIAELRKKLDIEPVKNTSLLEINAKSSDPKEAAAIANAVAEVYKEHRLEKGKALIRGGIEALNEQFTAQDEKIKEQQAVVARLERELREKEKAAQTTPPPVDVEPPPVRKISTNSPIPQPEVQVSENAFSTFSLNVSDVSFKLAGASLEKGQMPDVASIRSEEFINAFDYRDPEAAPGTAITFAWERARYPFAHNRDLLRFSLKTAVVGRQAGRPLNIVLLLDNSGSMERSDRVAIIREALHVLAKQLQPQDLFSVITFARTPRLWVDGFAGDKAGEVADQLSDLTPAGGTNLEEAMKLAYQTASRHYFVNGINRVVVLTDGAANLGNVDPESLKQMVESQRKQGIALDCFGIGWEGFNDDLLEVLSRNGDGRYGFLNSPEEAASEFAAQLAGALQVAASDVKVQVEFNPRRATAYRQIGYAKHQLTKQQFRDNTVDAAEIASQEAGNALYTVEVNPAGEGPICTVRVRYKIPGTTDYREQEWDVPFTGNSVSLESASPAMRLAATASAFSEWLAASPYAGEVAPNQLLNYLSGVPEIYGADGRPKKLEWMIRQAKSIEGK